MNWLLTTRPLKKAFRTGSWKKSLFGSFVSGHDLVVPISCLLFGRAGFSRRHKTGASEFFRSPLARPETIQRSFDPLYLVANDPDRLLMAGRRHGRNGFHRAANLAVVLPD